MLHRGQEYLTGSLWQLKQITVSRLVLKWINKILYLHLAIVFWRHLRYLYSSDSVCMLLRLGNALNNCGSSSVVTEKIFTTKRPHSTHTESEILESEQMCKEFIWWENLKTADQFYARQRSTWCDQKVSMTFIFRFSRNQTFFNWLPIDCFRIIYLYIWLFHIFNNKTY